MTPPSIESRKEWRHMMPPWPIQVKTPLRFDVGRWRTKVEERVTEFHKPTRVQSNIKSVQQWFNKSTSKMK